MDFPARSCILIDISIHAPREGGDEFVCEIIDIRNISIHAPREGGDKSTEIKRLAFF